VEMGQRCANAGSLGETTRGFELGQERWFCAQHYPPFRGHQWTLAATKPAGWRNPLSRPVRTVADLAEAELERRAIEQQDA